MHALKKIAVQIETASTSGRLIEGLAAILEKKKNYNQALSQMQEYFRESYSILVSEWKIKNNIVEVYSTPELPAAQDIYNEPKTNVIRGTRDLLNRVKGE